MPSASAIAPAARPSAPAWTSSLNTASRCSCASAPSAATAPEVFVSMNFEMTNRRRDVNDNSTFIEMTFADLPGKRSRC